MEVRLINLINRYNKDTELLQKHPEQSEMLTRRIAMHKEDIVNYVTREDIAEKVEKLNL